MLVQKGCVIMYRTEEDRPCVDIKRLTGAENLHARQPCGIDADPRLDGSPGMAGKRGLLIHLVPLDEILGRPCFIKAAKLLTKFLYIPLIAAESIRACQRLPVDGSEERPAPLIIATGFYGRIEFPVNRTCKIMPEYAVVKHRPGLLENTLILQCFAILCSKEVVRTCTGTEVMDYLSQRIVCDDCLHLFQVDLIAINESK
ncbi:hypothetical protein SDC9_177039 [bioreactor metagenome]|uniref:Uncharacterized protein n=1 Tax=bioreactor metagenome TaxID=1076179 RepID=A0A645GTN9_9ZZZZ